jgi:hypothetical protein
VNRCGIVRADRLLTSFCVSSVVEAQNPQLVSSKGISKTRTPNLHERSIAKGERARGPNLRRSLATVTDLSVPASFVRSSDSHASTQDFKKRMPAQLPVRGGQISSPLAVLAGSCTTRARHLRHSLQLPCLFSSKIRIPNRGKSVRKMIWVPLNCLSCSWFGRQLRRDSVVMPVSWADGLAQAGRKSARRD